jgi:hypothetical protein
VSGAWGFEPPNDSDDPVERALATALRPAGSDSYSRRGRDGAFWHGSDLGVGFDAGPKHEHQQ